MASRPPKRARAEPRFSTGKRAASEGEDWRRARYELRGGRRLVEPYEFEFNAFCKRRWVGRPLLSVLSSEFDAFSERYFRDAVERGRIRVNGERARAERVLSDGDFVSHWTHRHEPPVSWESPWLAFECAEYVVVSKPSTLPVHPCGAYRYNSLQYVLASERGVWPTFVVHRLDRATSGLVLLARDASSARRLSEKIERGGVRKHYYARVRGRFPAEAASLASSGPAFVPEGSVSVEGEWLVVSVGTRIRDPVRSVYECSAEGKPTVTRLRLHRYDAAADESVVECMPESGRTHQIRLHLQFLGFPIRNDPLYGGRSAAGAAPVARDHKPLEHFDFSSLGGSEEWWDRCAFCALEHRGEDVNAEAFDAEQMEWSAIDLHAFRYECDEWDHRVPCPEWVDGPAKEGKGAEPIE